LPTTRFPQGVGTMSMMPLGWFQRIDHRLIHQTGWKVHPRKIIIAILHKLGTIGHPGRVSQGQPANGKAVGEGREK
jgi:hypothetical protein